MMLIIARSVASILLSAFGVGAGTFLTTHSMAAFWWTFAGTGATALGHLLQTAPKDAEKRVENGNS